ncbi:MAG: hypothetical protein WD381_05875 [Balneolaceae bacterium]
MNLLLNKYLSVFLLLLLLAGCGQNDDQRDFERSAYSAPDGFTQTDEIGDIMEGNEDRDDWRVSPFYQGLVDIDSPAYPNPVQTTGEVRIEIFNRDDAVTSLRVIVIFVDGGTYSENEVQSARRDPLPANSTTVLSINPRELSRFDTVDGDLVGIKRIILLDATNNVVSYGDIMVE